jgi:hypothetical protein
LDVPPLRHRACGQKSRPSAFAPKPFDPRAGSGESWVALTFAKENDDQFMNENLIHNYLKRAQEIIGDRSLGEIEYDDAVIANLEEGKSIKESIDAANTLFPKEALGPDEYAWDDLDSRYQYLKEHKTILAKLNQKE